MLCCGAALVCQDELCALNRGENSSSELQDSTKKKDGRNVKSKAAQMGKQVSMRGEAGKSTI